MTWTCKKCGRIFARKGQQHSCKKVPVETHFKGKDEAEKLYKKLLAKLRRELGTCKVISLPCCIHLFGKFDFIAILPKSDGLELRFALNEKIKDPRIFAAVPLSSKNYKNCLRVNSGEELDKQLMGWLKRSYNLQG